MSTLLLTYPASNLSSPGLFVDIVREIAIVPMLMPAGAFRPGNASLLQLHIIHSACSSVDDVSFNREKIMTDIDISIRIRSGGNLCTYYAASMARLGSRWDHSLLTGLIEHSR